MTMDLQKFQGGRSWLARGAGLGVIGLVVALAGIFVDKKAALYSYLVAFSYWAGIAMTALVLLMTFHAFRAKWMTVIRRPLETMATTVLVFLPLSIPILAGVGEIYSWVHPSHDLPHHELHLLHHKAPYLNVPFFIARTVGYFVIAALVAWRLFGLSTRQDASGDPALTQKQRNLGTGALPLIAVVLTFASFDWLMSLNPLWFSTIFGVYYFAGSALSTVAILILVTNASRAPGNFGGFVSVEHMHNLGKLLFAFTCFWAYIAVSQFLLIWIANLPEETPFYIVRMKGPWASVGVALMVGHFALPFFVLITRDIKRKPVRLSLMCFWVLAVHLLDIYWLVMPSLTPEGPSFHWTLPFAWIGIGGVALAFAVWRIRGHYALPVKDPFLSTSLRYRQPI